MKYNFIKNKSSSGKIFGASILALFMIMTAILTVVIFTTQAEAPPIPLGGIEYDFGDAPDPTYQTLLASDGARHYIVVSSAFYLGSSIDSELDGQPTANAIGDDSTGLDDEDGVTFVTPLKLGLTTNINVVASAAGKLDAWIDFNIDGDWADAGEQICTSYSLNAGGNTVLVPIPNTATLGPTYARFRFSSAGGLSYTGLAADGEVEDYMVLIECEEIIPNYWQNFQPNDWWTVDQTPDVSVQVRDYESGLDVSTAEYRYSIDGGITWTAWATAACTGVDGTNNYETISVQNIPFNQDSKDKNKIEFRILDMCENEGSAMYTVKIDTQGPPQTVEFGNPKETYYYAPENKWYDVVGGSTLIYLNSTDLGIGSKNLTYYIQRGDNFGFWPYVSVPYTTVQDDVVIPGNPYASDADPTEGKISVQFYEDESCWHQIHYWCYDYLGHRSPPVGGQYLDFIVDCSPPVSTWDMMGPTDPSNEWMGACTYKVINATDVGCIPGGTGVAKIDWFIHRITSPTTYELYQSGTIYDDGEGDYNAVDGQMSIRINVDEDCEHYISYRVFDDLGHYDQALYIETPNKQYHKIDVTAPESYLTYTGPTCMDDNNEVCVKTDTILNINVNNIGTSPCIYPTTYSFFRVYYNGQWYPDPITGLGNYGVYTTSDARSLWKGVYWYDYTKTFSFTEECMHYLEFFAKDPLCNTEETHNITHYVDNQPPIIIKTIDGPNCPVPDTDDYCITTDTQIIISLENNGCCLNDEITLEYRVCYNDVWSDWMTYEGPISFYDECEHQLEVRAIDCLGNEATDLETFYVDESAPIIIKTLDGPNCPIPGTDNYCVTTDTLVTLSALDDDCCPLSDITIEYGYWYNDVWYGWFTYTGPFGFDEECEHVLYVRAYDCLGNGMDDSYWDVEKFYVDESAPIIIKTIDGPNCPIPDTDNYCITTETQIIVSAENDDCCPYGEITLEYRIWYDGIWSEWMTYECPITFAEECKHYLEVRAIDCLGNEVVDNETFYVDETVPTIIKIVGDPYCLLSGITSDLQNPGFETGDFTGWTIDAAYDSVTVVTADGFTSPYAGTYMARLADDNGDDEQPIGDNKISQVFTVTQDTFAFAYNLFTYDYAPYDFFGYSLKTADGLTTIAEYSQSSWDESGLKSTGWQFIEIDVSSYFGQQLKFEITCGGTLDTEGPMWAYVDCTTIDSDDYCVTTDTLVTLSAIDDDCCPLSDITIEYGYWYNDVWYGWFTYAEPFNFEETCEHILYVRAYDCLGNGMSEEYWDVETFYVDESAPIIIKTIDGPNCPIPDTNDYCITTETQIILSAENDGCCPYSEITLEYRVWYDGIWSEWMTYECPITFAEECEHQLEVRATDCLGNQATDLETFYVDESAPIIIKTLDGPNCPIPDTDNYCITTETQIIVSAENDDCCPYNEIVLEYRIWYDGEWSGWMNYEAPITFVTECKHYLEVRAIDCLGNEVVDNETFYVDETAPEITKTVGEPKYQIPGTVNYCITTDTQITLSAADLGCCPWSEITIEYGYWYNDVWYGWFTYTGPFSFDEECEHVLYVRAYDCLGNGMDDNYWDVETFYVDETAPEIYKYVGQPSYMVPGTDDYCVTTDTLITVEIVDESCCPCESTVDYRIWYDGIWSEWMPYVEGISFDEECEHVLEIRASDCLGNYVVDSETFYVDETPPEIVKTVGEPNCPIPDTNDYCVTTDTIITITATDGGCCPGCDAFVEYRIWYDGEWSDWMTYEGPISFYEECEHVLEVRATDCLGNYVVDSETFYVDETPPILVKTVGDPKAYLGLDTYGHDQWMIYPGTEICFTAEDLGCGPCSEQGTTIIYRIWYLGEWTEWTTYTDCITLTQGCVHYLEAKASDCLGNWGEIDNETFWVCAPSGDSDPNVQITYPTMGSTVDEEILDVIIKATDGETSWEDLNVYLWIPGGRRDAPYLYYEVTPLDGEEDYYVAHVPIYCYQDGAQITLEAAAMDEEGNAGFALPVTFTIESTIVWDQWMQKGWNSLTLPPEGIGCDFAVKSVLASIDGCYDWVFWYNPETKLWDFYSYDMGGSLVEMTTGEEYWVHMDGVAARYYTDTNGPSIDIEYPLDGAILTELTDIYGTASDIETGIKEVYLTIYDSNSDQYWDGDEWVSTETTLACVGTESWSYYSSIISWVGHDYIITATAVDMAGCETSDFVTVTVDNTPPEVMITYPDDGDVLSEGPNEITVQTFDLEGDVSEVYLMLYDQDLGYYWNSWDPTPTWHPCTNAGPDLWVFDSSGVEWTSCHIYEATSRAYDIFGNYVDDVNVFTISCGGECIDDRTYTTDADFEEGVFVGGIYAEDDQLQLTPGEGTTYPVMWIANSGESSVSKWDTNENRELARYKTFFYGGGSHSGPAPSRTCVDSDGNCYVANRQFDSYKSPDVLKILTNDYIDRNSNGIIDTSYDANNNSVIDPSEMLPLIDTNGNDKIDPDEIQDERIAWAVEVGPEGGLGRSLSIDLDGNIWLGCYNSQQYYKISGVDGSLLAGPISTSGHTPYGSLVDKHGILWGASLTTNMLRLDTNTHAVTILDHSAYAGNYGIALGYDSGDNTIVYLGSWGGNTFIKYDSLTNTFSAPAEIKYSSRGIATDSEGNILAGYSGTWLSNEGGVSKFSPNGTLIWSQPSQVGSNEARGVVVDSNDNVWTVHLTVDKIAKYQGTDGTPLGSFNTGDYPYTYSDAAGLSYSGSVVTGKWSTIHDSQASETIWNTISWTSDEPEGTNITVKARSSEDQSTWSSWEDAQNDAMLMATPTGRYIEIEVSMKITSGETSPILYDITIDGTCAGTPPEEVPEGIGATIIPDTLEITLPPGGSIVEDKTVILDEIPIGKLDVLFVFDLTGSMYGVIDEAKASSIDIMNDISLQVEDSAFGVGSFMDYPSYYSSCDYSSTYGSYSDYPWELDQSITTDTSLVSTAVNGLPYGSGYDGPESYTRALYESQFAGWRLGARKVVIIFEDNIPHDCDFSTFGCSGYSTGVDPGRDAIANTGDDLTWVDTVNQLKEAGISVVSVDCGGGWNSCPWLYASDETNGIYTLLGDDTLAEKIVELIEDVTGTISYLTFETKAGYEDWFDWTPEGYSDVPGGETVEFDVTITVPEGTAPGLYHTWLMVMGDGSILAVQEQWITVTEDGEPPCEPDFTMEKTVWHDEYWDEYTEVDVGDIVTFNITVVIGPDSCPLLNGILDDYLPVGLSYVEYSTSIKFYNDGVLVYEISGEEDCEPDITPGDGYNLLTWDSENGYGENVPPNSIGYFEFDVEVMDCDDYTNTVNAIGYYTCCDYIQDEDTAEVWAYCEEGEPPVVDITYPIDGAAWNYGMSGGILPIEGTAYDTDTYVDEVQVALYYTEDSTTYYYTNIGWSTDECYRSAFVTSGSGTFVDPLHWNLLIEPGFLLQPYQCYIHAVAYDHDPAPLMGEDTIFFWFPEIPFDLSGTVYYTGDVTTGEFRITLFDESISDPDSTPISIIDADMPVSFPFDYTFYNLAPGTYYVAAQIDLDYSGGPPTEGEIDGIAINQTLPENIDPIVITNADVYDVDVTLFEVPSTNNPPYIPNTPDPADGAIDVPTYGVTLEWYGGDPDGAADGVIYDIYFGLESDPLYYDTTSCFSGGVDWIGWSVGLLDDNAQYYWKIVAEDEGGLITQGPIWSFTTEEESLGLVHNIDTDEWFIEIQTAISDDDTLSGHTIEVYPSIYYENPDIDDKELTLLGIGMPVIEGYDFDCGVWVSADNVIIDGFEIRGCNGEVAGIVVADDATNIRISNCSIHDNDVGIYLDVYDATISIVDNEISENIAGGIYATVENYLHVDILRNIMSFNGCSEDSYDPGGAIRLQGTDDSVSVIDAVINDNTIDQTDTSGGHVRVGWTDDETTTAETYVTMMNNYMTGGNSGIFKINADDYLNVYAEGNDFVNLQGCVNKIGWCDDSSAWVEDMTVNFTDNTFTDAPDASSYGMLKITAFDTVDATFIGNTFSHSLQGGTLRIGWTCDEGPGVAQWVNAVVCDNEFTDNHGGAILVWAESELSANISNNYVDGTACSGLRHAIEICSDGDLEGKINSNTITNFGMAGIYVYAPFSPDVEIKDNDISYGDGGIVVQCENVVIDNNDVVHMIYDGIVLAESTGCTVKNNYVDDCGDDAFDLDDSTDNIIMDNTGTNSAEDGIDLEESDNNDILNNMFIGNLGDGLSIDLSDDNIISGNTVTGNAYGINLFGPSNNNIIYNNYFDNANNAWDEGTNQWNLEPPIEETNIIDGDWLGGNFYSDYTGEDTTGDGLGEDPYLISGGSNQDNHPLTDQMTFDGIDPADFVGYWKFDEGSGTTTADSSGHGITGTIYGSPTWMTGKVGQCLRFAETNSYVKLLYSDGVSVSGDWTVMAWVYAGSSASNGQIITRTSDAGWEYGGLQLFTKNDNKAWLDMHSGGSDAISDNSVRDSNWHHVVGMRDSSGNLKIYIDGVISSTTGYSGVTDTTTFNWFIGAWCSGGYVFQGYIDEVAILDRVLTNDEIQLCYNNGLAGHGYIS